MNDEPVRILVVDDNPKNLDILSDLLDQQGFNVLFALDGISGIQRAEAGLPDLILLDVMMPELDGFETCRQLKTNDKTKDIPVIFMTVLSDTADKIKGFTLGAVDYITKPIHPQEVLARIETHLALRNLQKSLHEKNIQLQREITERKRAEEALQKAHDDLEKRVEERTVELSKANERLKQEILERKQAEEALRESEEKFRQLAENLNLAFTLRTADKLLYASPAYETITGRSLKDYYANPDVFLDYIHPDDRERIIQVHYSEELHKTGFVDTEYRILRPDGTVRWLQVRAVPVLNERGDVIRRAGFTEDITERKLVEEELRKHREHLEELVEERTAELQQEVAERKRAEEALRKAKADLEAANRDLEKRVQAELQRRQEQQQLLIQRSKLESLGKLAAGIAHEINQPLAGISMGLDNILFKLSSNNVTEKYLQNKIDSFLEDIERINQIIHHVRVFSRDQTSVLLENVNVNEVCQNALSMLQTQYQNHNVNISLNLDDTIGVVVGNKYKLEQVVLNLIANAKDAVDEKGRRIGESSYQKQIKITTSCDANRIYLDIEDNGPGIPEEHQENIFDPFFTTKDPEQGTGLGLSVSYGIIKEMHGDISVQSQPGKYTMMRISLPRVKLNSHEGTKTRRI